MLDKSDLLAIREMFAEQKTEIKQDMSAQKAEIIQDVSVMLAEQKTEIMQEVSAMFAVQKTEIMQEVSVLMESKFMPIFNLLAEGQRDIFNSLITASRVEALEQEVKLVKVVVKQHSEELKQLKKA